MKTRAGLMLGLLATVLGARTYNTAMPHATPARPAGSHATDDKKGKDGEKKLTLTSFRVTPTNWFDGKKKDDKTVGKLAATAPIPPKKKKDDDKNLAATTPKKPKKDDNQKLVAVTPKKPKKDDGKLLAVAAPKTPKKDDHAKAAGTMFVKTTKKKGPPRKADGYDFAAELV